MRDWAIRPSEDEDMERDARNIKFIIHKTACTTITLLL